MKAGTRVYAIRDSDESTVHAFGLGTYVGDYEYPSDGPGLLGGLPEKVDRALAERALRKGDTDLTIQAMIATAYERGEINTTERDELTATAYKQQELQRARPMEERIDELLAKMRLNPKIILDDDRGVVWGCECWWGPADDSSPESHARGRTIITVEAPHPPEKREGG